MGKRGVVHVLFVCFLLLSPFVFAFDPLPPPPPSLGNTVGSHFNDASSPVSSSTTTTLRNMHVSDEDLPNQMVFSLEQSIQDLQQSVHHLEEQVKELQTTILSLEKSASSHPFASFDPFFLYSVIGLFFLLQLVFFAYCVSQLKVIKKAKEEHSHQSLGFDSSYSSHPVSSLSQDKAMTFNLPYSLKRYLQQCKNAHYPPEKVKALLQAAGYPYDVIENILKNY